MHWTREVRLEAYKEVAKAIRDGRLRPISSNTRCVDCGGPAYCYEHRNYFRPLDVEPVCRTCNNVRGEAYPPLQGRADTSIDKDFHSGVRWSALTPSVSDKYKKRAGGYDSASGGDAQKIARRTLDEPRDFSMPLRWRIAFDELHGGYSLRGGKFRSDYFKQHDPFYVGG